MFWDISQATRLTTLVGARSKSSCVCREATLPSTSSPRPVTTRRVTKVPLSPRHLFVVSFLLALLAVKTSAQLPLPLAPGKDSQQRPGLRYQSEAHRSSLPH